ncbi:MAG: chromosomal replication initiator protein DnaA [Anaerovoracaceae bacterium]
MSAFNDKWENTLELLRGDLNPTAYETWFAGLEPVSLDEKQGIIHIEAENSYIRDTINRRYLQMLEGAVSIAFKTDLKVDIKTKEQTKTEEKSFPGKGSNAFANTNLDEEYYLNPRFSFDTFIQGKNNEFAYSAALAVAKDPAKQYNPLFLYGGSGLGKTHLMHAIGKYVLEHFDNKNVLYVSSEMFTNELITAISKGTTSEFKKKYRTIDVLLMDDIQFIQGKDRTQEEFFYTFNTLYDNNKQIVISSDRSPKKLTSLDNRLISRFLWSISADITPPDYETRVAILQSKAEQEGIELTPNVNEVINLICEKIKYNVRELEGAFTRIISFSTLMHRPVNLALARDTLKDYLSASDLKITIETVKKRTAKYYGITIKDMDSSKRTRNLTHPRQVAMYLSKEMTDSSFPKIGQSFGGRDHTTAMHAYKKISKEIEENDELKAEIDELSQIINES